MNWIPLVKEEQLSAIKEKSKQSPQLIFKHSTRCSISSVVKSRLEKGTPPAGVECYFLDLIANRRLSDAVAKTFDVYHESPQILLINNGECVYDESHMGINLRDIAEQAQRQKIIDNG